MLKLFNSLTRKLELFQQTEDKEVKMYTCGPSTYQRSHIGNFRTFLYEDVLQRYLEYLGLIVKRLIAITDVEDKALREAEKEEVSIEVLTSRNEAAFFKDFDLLRIKRPEYVVRASSIANQASQLIEGLLQKGIAYRYIHEGAENIYFDPLKFEGFGKLAQLDMSKWPKEKRRFHKDTYPGTPWNKGDFILWHGCGKKSHACWDTKIGRGRPSWNIQDAAMVTKHLGFQVDLACGGVDNLVRHHDYTIAVAEAISGIQFAKYWLHGEHLLVNNEKMSKSKGNVFYPQDLMAKGYRGEQIRFFLIYGNYRFKQNFTWQKLAEASGKMNAFRNLIQGLKKVKCHNSSTRASALARSVPEIFRKHMDNDLGVKNAFDSLNDLLVRLHQFSLEGKLSSEDAQTAIADIVKVDDVLRVIL